MLAFLVHKKVAYFGLHKYFMPCTVFTDVGCTNPISFVG